jgi:hypothetical protein
LSPAAARNQAIEIKTLAAWRRPVPYFCFMACLSGRLLSAYGSAEEANTFLFARLDLGLRLRRQLQHGCRLAFAQ